MSEEHKSSNNPDGTVRRCDRRSAHEPHDWQGTFGDYFDVHCPGNLVDELKELKRLRSSNAVLDCPMDPNTNDANASTVRQYLASLLEMLWREDEAFSGKRPFGNSGWQYEVYFALVKHGVVEGVFDEEFGELEDFSPSLADFAIVAAIRSLQ